MNKKPKGTLIIIGGHEDKEGDRIILEEVARRARRGRGLVLVTVATELPQAVAADYRKVFRSLDLPNVPVLDLRMREDALLEENVEKLRSASVVFFTGGDQLRITSQLGDTPIFQCLHEVYEQGGTIVGTSAGAAVMSETMLINGSADSSAEISGIGMAPGFGLVDRLVIDTHFAERGRFGRLLGAVVQNPANLGIGLDENTAIVVERNESFRVIGSGAVYVVDGTDISYSSLSEANPEGTISIYDCKLHVLATGDRYDLVNRRPVITEAEERALRGK